MPDTFTYLNPILKTATEYERNERLKHWVWLAARGSTSALIRLHRMSDENKHRALLYSPAGTNNRLNGVLNAPHHYRAEVDTNG